MADFRILESWCRPGWLLFAEKLLLFSFSFLGEEEEEATFFVSKSYFLVRGREEEGEGEKGGEGLLFVFRKVFFFLQLFVFFEKLL